MTMPLASPRTILETALRLAGLGLRVAFAYGVKSDLECQCGSDHSSTRSSIGKHPIGKQWQRRASTDPQVLRDSYIEGCNVGIVCGEQPDGRHVIAIDVDDPARFASLCVDLGDLPPTLTGQSPRGSRLLFHVPEAISNRPLDGVDIKGSNGFVVVGPSRHHSGNFYTELEGELAELPTSWLAFLRPTPKPPPALSSWEPTDRKARTRAERWARAVLIAECRLLAQAAEGTRNQTLYHAALRAFSCFRGVQLSDAEAHSELISAAKACGLKELETRRTLQSVEKYLDESGQKRTPPDRPSPVAPYLSGSTPTNSEPASSLKLVQDSNQQPAKLAENVARVLETDPAFAGGPRLDRLSLLPFWPLPLPAPLSSVLRLDREVVEPDYDVLHAHCYREHRLHVGREVVQHGVRLAISRGPAYDSLAEFVRALPAWDGVPRLDTWTTTYLGCEDTSYHRAIGAAWLKSALHRALHPGDVVDLVPVFIGPQKSGKNRAIDILFAGGPKGAPFLAPLGAWRPDHPDTKRLACTRWVLHDDEFSARDERTVDALKSWVSRISEQWVAKYSNDVTVMLRRAVLVCSVNNDAPLKDPTGGRRFGPLRVGVAKLDAIARDREQLLAEALLNASTWREHLPSDALQEDAVGAATAEDGLVSGILAIDDWPEYGFTVHALGQRLGFSADRIDRSSATRIGQAATAAGCRVVRVLVRGTGKIRLYFKT